VPPLCGLLYKGKCTVENVRVQKSVGRKKQNFQKWQTPILRATVTKEKGGQHMECFTTVAETLIHAEFANDVVWPVKDPNVILHQA